VTAAEDIDAIRSAYAAWNRGDVNGLLEAMGDEVEVVPVLGDVVSADRFCGHEGVRHWYETVHSTLENFRAEVEDVIEIGGGRYLVKLRFSGHGKASGAPVALDAAHILTVQGGKAVRLVGYLSWEEAAAAAGITESRRAGSIDRTQTRRPRSCRRVARPWGVRAT
jgi:ketosteroid isomerase-like protein